MITDLLHLQDCCQRGVCDSSFLERAQVLWKSWFYPPLLHFPILHLSKWIFMINFATTEEMFHLIWSLEVRGRDFWQNILGLCFSDPSALIRHCNVKREVKERKA